jgi:hypothetical protein
MSDDMHEMRSDSALRFCAAMCELRKALLSALLSVGVEPGAGGGEPLLFSSDSISATLLLSAAATEPAPVVVFSVLAFTAGTETEAVAVAALTIAILDRGRT